MTARFDMTYCRQVKCINWHSCPRAANEKNTRNWPEGRLMSQAMFTECFIEGEPMEPQDKEAK